MLKLYVQTTALLERLRAEKAGTVSFEYIVVAAAVVGAVVAAYGSGSTGAIKTALSNGIAAVVAQLPTSG